MHGTGSFLEERVEIQSNQPLFVRVYLIIALRKTIPALQLASCDVAYNQWLYAPLASHNKT